MTRYKYDCLQDSEDDRDILFHDTFKPLLTVPDKYDLRQMTWMPDPLDRGESGGSVANAVSNVLKFELGKVKDGQIFQPSRNFMHYYARRMQGGVDIDNGCSIRNLLKAVALAGACSENKWPYDQSHYYNEPNLECQNAGKQHIRNFRYMSVAHSLTNIKQAVTMGFPVIASMRVYEDFEADTTLTSGNIRSPNALSENYLGEHCVVIYGFDDDKQEVIIQDSRGGEVGEKGCFRVKYDYILDPGLCRSLWTVSGFV